MERGEASQPRYGDRDGPVARNVPARPQGAISRGWRVDPRMFLAHESFTPASRVCQHFSRGSPSFVPLICNCVLMDRPTGSVGRGSLTSRTGNAKGSQVPMERRTCGVGMVPPRGVGVPMEHRTCGVGMVPPRVSEVPMERRTAAPAVDRRACFLFHHCYTATVQRSHV